MGLKLGEEDYAQITVADWCGVHGIEMHHFALERQCSPAQGKILKRKGVKKGVPDIYIPVPCVTGSGQMFQGVWIELKIHPNKPTKEQRDFLERRNKQGYYAGCITGKTSTECADKAILLIKSFYGK